MIAIPLHDVKDVDDKPRAKMEVLAKKWVASFGGKLRSVEIQDVMRSFTGTALVRVRATVGHDGYDRLVNVTVPLGECWIPAGVTGTSPISDPLNKAEAVGVNPYFLVQKAMQEEGVSEFCRFYIDRRRQELAAAGSDPRKRKKIEDDFTPRLEANLVGLAGDVRRQLSVQATYELGTGHQYGSSITGIPSENKITCRRRSGTFQISPVFKWLNWRDMMSVRQPAVGPFNMSKSFRVLMLLILAPWSLVSQTADSDATVIAEHIEIPAYPPLARQARMSGEVKLRLLVQRSGEVVSVSVASVTISDGVPASSAVAQTVIDGIRESFVDVATRAAEKSQFSCPTCKGATFDHSITYQFQHPPVPKRACNPRPKDKIPLLPGPTIDSPNHVTVRPTAWPCVDT